MRLAIVSGKASVSHQPSIVFIHPCEFLRHIIGLALTYEAFLNAIHCTHLSVQTFNNK